MGEVAVAEAAVARTASEESLEDMYSGMDEVFSPSPEPRERMTTLELQQENEEIYGGMGV